MTGLRRFSQWSLWFGGALILVAALLIGIDVLLRKFLLVSIGGSDELAGYALAIGTAWSLGGALLDRAHIRIDSLYLLFPGRLRVALDLLGVALMMFFFGLTAWHGWGVVEQSWTSGSRSQSALEIPTVIPQILWFAGLVSLLVIGAILFAKAAMVAATEGRRAASALVGTKSAQEEVEEEMRGIQERAAQDGVH